MTRTEPLDVLGEPVRRRILELIGAAELPAGAIAVALGAEFGLSQPAASQHLKVLREAGLLLVRAEGTSRLYRLDRARLADAAAWFDQFADSWQQPLDALETELARGRREQQRRSLGGARAVGEAQETA
ncbi:MAG: metalloregulator ArsR/SmtB family transcription factor [Microlunatus sp.]